MPQHIKQLAALKAKNCQQSTLNIKGLAKKYSLKGSWGSGGESLVLRDQIFVSQEGGNWHVSGSVHGIFDN